MTKLKFLPIVNTALILGCIIFYGISQLNKSNKDAIVYVDTVRLFSEFNMTNDLKRDQANMLKNASKIQDSLVKIYNVLPNKTGEQASRLRSVLTLENQKLQELQQNLYQEINTRVWNRLNGYIKEFQELHNLDIILGSNGTGNSIHATNNLDKTESVLEYVNKRFEGAGIKNH